MQRATIVVIVLLLSLGALAQEPSVCSCGSTPRSRPANRTMKPYAQEPEDLRPYSKFATPYYENYTDLIEYNGAARDIPDPDLKDLNEIRIGFIGPISNHPDEVFGRRMLHGAQMAIDEANAKGGYCGKPFKLMLHNDSAVWGASSNEIVKMVYDDKVWAIFGSISGDTTHIALRVALRAEVPLINSAATDPTIPETAIPWFLDDLQDDRVQGYTLARRIYTELGLKRVAILRVNDRYGRFGVIKFRDASRRLEHPVVIEQKYMPGDTDFRHQLRVINGERTDAIVLWTDQAQAALILKQMRELGMNQRVFGSHRTIGDELLAQAGDAAEGFEAVFPYDASSTDSAWTGFNTRFESKYNEKPDQFASLAYDAMQVLLRAICRAGLNRGRIRDALTATDKYNGVTGEMIFDSNCKDIRPMFLATVRNGRIVYRPATMEKAYARVGEDGVEFHGPAENPAATADLRIAVFGPKADELVKSPEVVRLMKSAVFGDRQISAVAIPSEGAWGKASQHLVNAVYNDHVLGIIALDRNSAHLAEQIALKSFVPVIAISSDRTLTSINVPWIFRLPPAVGLEQALRCFSDAVQRAGNNPEKIRAVLASGSQVGGLRFQSTGELK